MTSKVTLAYSVTATNASTASLAAFMAAYPLYVSTTADPFLCQDLGLTVASDTVTTVGRVVTRTLVLNLAPAAGAPFAPPAQGVPLRQPPPKGAQLAIYSSSVQDTTTGTGARQVSVSYIDRNGTPGTSVANLQGKQPVPVPLQAGTVDFAGGIVSVQITTAGIVGANVGQLTLSILNAPVPLPVGFNPQNAASYFPVLSGAVLADALQMLLGFPVAVVPVSYSQLDPGFTGALLTNLFTYTLQLAISTSVTPSAPVFS